MRRFIVLILACGLGIGCGRRDAPVEAPPAAERLVVGEGPKEFAGVHHVIRVSDKLLSGSSPEGDEGFATLRSLGIMTIITVDGAQPEVERARKFGLRYVHLPIGYDGVPREQALRIARAVRDLPGLVYLHCHHGKHRAPAAAAAVTRCLDDQCTAAKALGLLKQAGTAAHYKGLYAAVDEFAAITPEELDKVSVDFPEVAPTGMFVQHMVDVDTRWDHLKLIKTAGWKAPPKHPDLDPAHEALLLRETYRESTRLPDVQQRSAELVQWLQDAEQHVQSLEDLLRQGEEKGAVAMAAVEKAYKQAAADCTHCHAKYRDVPR